MQLTNTAELIRKSKGKPECAHSTSSGTAVCATRVTARPEVTPLNTDFGSLMSCTFV